MDDLSGLLDHGRLVFSYRHGRRLKGSNVRSLADGIGEKANRNACFKVAHLNLRFYRRISLETGNRHKIHIVEGHLTELRDLGLDKQSRLLRIQTAGQVIKGYFDDILAYFFRIICIVCQCLSVCDHNIYFIKLTGILQFHSAF